jgi:hypothetical protein
MFWKHSNTFLNAVKHTNLFLGSRSSISSSFHKSSFQSHFQSFKTIDNGNQNSCSCLSLSLDFNSNLLFMIPKKNQTLFSKQLFSTKKLSAYKQKIPKRTNKEIYANATTNRNTNVQTNSNDNRSQEEMDLATKLGMENFVKELPQHMQHVIKSNYSSFFSLLFFWFVFRFFFLFVFVWNGNFRKRRTQHYNML